MKKLLQIVCLIISLGLTISTFAQQVQKNYINYQGVASDAAGDVMANQNINIDIALKFGASGVAASYEETHVVTTNENGVFSLLIGNGTIVTGNYDTLLWGDLAVFATISVNGTEIGTTELFAVPYAIRAGNGGGAKKINNLQDGRSDDDGTQDGSSLFLGVDAGLNDDGTDNSNIGIGFQSLMSNTSGNLNTATGSFALYENITGTHNTANGRAALGNNTTGNFNTASGFGALLDNTTGIENTANGSQALRRNRTGSFNTANGAGALLFNITGPKNTATGFEALYKNDTGYDNVAVGYRTLYENKDGFRNAAVGLEALGNNTTGNYNTAIGYAAMLSHTAGNNNTAVGWNAQVQVSNGSNQIRMGNTSVVLASVQVAWMVTSDAVWKDDIQELTYGLDMVTQLKPVDYIRKNNESNTREIGFIAQDVELLLNKLGYTNTGMLTKDDNGNLSLRYNDFIPVLTKAVQELHDKTTALEKMNEQLIKRIVALENN